MLKVINHITVQQLQVQLSYNKINQRMFRLLKNAMCTAAII